MNPISKTDLLDGIRREHQRLADRLQQLAPAPSTHSDAWDAQTILAHIAIWEKLTLTRLEAARAGAVPQVPPIGSDAEIDRLNDRILAEARGRDRAEVLNDFFTSHAALVAALESYDDDFIRSPLPTSWGRGRTVWELIAANTIWHYLEHMEMLEK